MAPNHIPIPTVDTLPISQLVTRNLTPNMQTVKLIQYVERFDSEKDGLECLYNLANLDGYLGGRVIHKPEAFISVFPFVMQAFFECSEDTNPEAFDSQYGMRAVNCPISLIANLNRK